MVAYVTDWAPEPKTPLLSNFLATEATTTPWPHISGLACAQTICGWA
jgi:hypothetical protein